MEDILQLNVQHLPIYFSCLLYTSDAADDSLRVDLGGRRIIKKKNFFKQKTAYEISACLVGSEMCIRDRRYGIITKRVSNGLSKNNLDCFFKTRFWVLFGCKNEQRKEPYLFLE